MRKLVFLFFLGISVVSPPSEALPTNESKAHFQESWRKVRRMGVGLNVSGVYGVAGIQMELNLSKDWCTQIGYGGGSDHSAFAFQVKRVLGGTTLNPYLSTGLVHWASRADGPVGSKSLTPSYLSAKFLSDEQKSAPSFEEILLPLTLGLQYVHNQGAWSGTSVFVEVNALADVEDMRLATTGTLGMSYFF